jgi:hypothetical protein
VSRDLWATYSVRDHLNPRTLAVDMMLFDRLVFPVPEDAYFPQNSGSLMDRGSVEWKRNDAEWAVWEKNKWNPVGQSKLLNVLSPVVRKVSWKTEGVMEDKYREEAMKLTAKELPGYAFQFTRTFLTRDLPAHVTGVSAVGPAYRNYAKFRRECTSRELGTSQPLPGEAVATVLASRFFVPDISDPEISTEQLLKRTVEFVTDNTAFRDRRAAFNEWQQDFIRNGATDYESISRAVQKMSEMLEAANETAKKLRVRKVARYLCRLAPSALGVAAAFASKDPRFAEGGLFLSACGIAVDEKLFKSSEQAQIPAVAFVHDARRHFGWK